MEKADHVELPTEASRHAKVVRNVRGTLVLASRNQIVTLGLETAYEKALSPECSRSLRDVLATSWVPIRLASAHYKAADSLQMREADVIANHRRVADRVHGILLGTAMRGLRAVGLFTPWHTLQLAPKLASRVLDGGSTTVERGGPSDATVVFTGNPLLQYPYYRLGLRIHLLVGMERCTPTVEVKELTCQPSVGSVKFSVRWAGT